MRSKKSSALSAWKVEGGGSNSAALYLPLSRADTLMHSLCLLTLNYLNERRIQYDF